METGSHSVVFFWGGGVCPGGGGSNLFEQLCVCAVVGVLCRDRHLFHASGVCSDFKEIT